MSIDSKYLDFFIKATECAAIGASNFIGKQDKIAADKGAVDPMRRELNKINMDGTVVIGEGEMDEAPMLYIGEKLGTLNGPKFDLAVDWGWFYFFTKPLFFIMNYLFELTKNFGIAILLVTAAVRILFFPLAN